MSLLRIQQTVPFASANEVIFDLFHSGKCTIGGRVIRLENPVLPVLVKQADHIVWTFPEPLKVSTPGPDSRLTEIKQYRDRITAEVWPWATIEVKVIE